MSGIGVAPLPSSSETAYPAGPYYDFYFPNTRTAGWTRNGMVRGLYAVLNRVTRGKIDTVPQPHWMEWPQLLLIAVLVPMWTVTNALMLFVL